MLKQGLRQALLEIGKVEFANGTHAAVEFLDGNRRHLHAIEPVLLDHGVAGRILDGDAVAISFMAFARGLGALADNKLSPTPVPIAARSGAVAVATRPNL